jgi:two-component system chemotaxis sensor kinase CheA
MIVDALLVEIGGQQMAVPQPVLREIIQVDASEVATLENNAIISYRSRVLPLISLRTLFGFPPIEVSSLYVLVVGHDTQLAGLVVDRICGLREIVVKPITDPLLAVPGVSGATELGDGRISLILDASALVRVANRRAPTRRAETLSLAAG